ncbi:gliding motility-associated C-terminal domain-containing protein [Neolewinella agarilytica]|uniref:gliding motility-associated C-terminal domain-containing protein n=1 Tax=Neolewinella agarilytica TaxID=478744 RepID=UPI0023559AD3|nr:gliding motility-associated C-terminal domain-containing protein [Neolewinella agarilytica]
MKFSTYLTFAFLLAILPLTLFAQAPANDICELAVAMPPFARLQTCPADDGVSFSSSISGTNIDAGPTAPFPSSPNCTNDASPDVYFRFQASGAINDITVTTNDMNSLQIFGFVGDDCNNIQFRACGEGRTATMRIIAQPGQRVFILVAGAPGDLADQGTFDIEVESSSNCSACARDDNGEVTINPRNASATYACGSTAEICFTLYEWSGNDAGSVEWIHAMVPTLGPGWDLTTITPTVIPGSCSGSGSWGWYPAGWTGCFSGDSFDRGFAYETTAGQGDCTDASNTGPGNNYGDGGAGCTAIPAPLTWCFTVDVKDCPPGSNTFTGEDLTVSVQVLSDAFSGSWNQQVCGTPTFETIASVIVCDDLEPIAMPTAEDCPGAENGFFDIQANGGLTPGLLYNFTVRDETSTAVFVCNGCPSPVQTRDLPPGDYTIEAIGIISGCPQVTTGTIDPGDPVDVTAEHSDVCPDGGAIELIGSTTTPGTVIDYNWTGPGGFTANGASAFTADPAVEGTYTLTITVDGCDSDPTDVEVEYLVFDPQANAVNDNLCFGDDLEMEVTDGGTDFEWYDPDGNIIGSNSATITTTAGGPGGIQTYSVNISDANCSVTRTVDVFVADEITGMIIMNPNGEVCEGEDIEFSIRQADGSFFPSGWTFDWNNGDGTGTTYTLTAAENLGYPPGPYTMEVVVTNPSMCSATVAEPFRVLEGPEVSISPDAPTICADGMVTLMTTVSGGTEPYTYLWGPDNVVTSSTLTVDVNSTTTEAIYVEVTDANGCTAFSNFADVAILPALVGVNFGTCVSDSPSEITFSWNDVGQDRFEVYLTEGVNPETTISTTYTDLSYTATGITPGTNVTIRVVPIAVNNGVTCAGPEQSTTCSTQSCDNPGWQFTAIEPVCLTTDGQAFDFTINTSLSGNVLLNSTDLSLTDVSTGPGGVTAVSLPALSAGTTAGTYTVTASFALPDGSCPFDTILNIPVVTPANPEISTPMASICAAQADVDFMMANAADPNTSYTISIDNPAGTTILQEDPANQLYQIRFTEFRTYQITLTARTMGNINCSDSFTIPFTLVRPPARPTLTCEGTGLDSVAIGWTDVGADSYTVDPIDVPAGGVIERTTTGFIVRNLNAGDAVEIAVTANSAGCSPVVSDTIVCVAQSCANIVPVITTPVDTFCSDGTEMLVDLTVNVPAAGTVMWSGPGVDATQNQFDPAAAGRGEHIITVVYTEGTCTYPVSFQLVVVDPPFGTVDIDADDICQDGTATVSFTGGNLDNANFEWILPADATLVAGDVNGPGPLDVSFSGTGRQFAQLLITGPFCEIDTLRDSIIVAEPIPPVTIDCANVSFDQVGFSWTHPTATNFTVTIIDQPAGAMITQTNNSLLATGLAEGESVTIEVTALGVNACGDADAASETCTAQSCPNITFSIDPVASVCEGEEVDIQLATTVTGSDGSGTVTFADGGTGMFNTAGRTAGSYRIDATFNEGGCAFPAFIDIVIDPVPVASFSLPTGPVCIDEVVSADAGAEVAGNSYEWTIAAADATVVSPSNTVREVSWSTPGRKGISLVVTNAMTCESEIFTDSIDVIAPLMAPAIGCGVSSPTSVEFSWAMEAGVDSFQVSVDGGAPFFQDSTNLFVGGLSQGDVVTITVIAMGSGVCGNSEPATQPCVAGSCPTITVAPPAAESFCLGDPTNDIVLAATQSGAAGTGAFVFAGNGVTENAGVYSFNPDAAGAGVHTITVTYNEGVCSGTATFDWTVNEVPTSDFTLNGQTATITVCEGESFTALYTGGLTAADGATFGWGFASAAGGPDGNFESYSLSYDDAGEYTISLVVTANDCVSDTSRLTVTVEAPLAAPVVSCTGADLNSVTFGWDAVPGAEGYLVSDGTMLTATERSHVVTGLEPGESVSITVIAVSTAACGNSPASESESCMAEECPTLAIDLSGLVDEVCLLNGDETIDLTTVLITGGSGTGAMYQFSGNGVTGTTFDAAAAGGSEAGVAHSITVNYVEAGPCTFSGDFDLTVFERPAAFITEANPECVGRAVSILIGSTNFVSDDDIQVDWDGGIVQEDDNPDDNSYLVVWDTPGTKTIIATVVSNISGCESLPVMREVVIESPLAMPVVSCGQQELESITFLWDAVPGAMGYQVTLSDETVAIIDTVGYTVTGLSPETTLGISVVALNSGPCGNSVPGTVICETLPCPGGSIQAITQDQDMCLDGDEQAITLEAALDMGTPTGPVEWSGTGVVDMGNGMYTFDPTGLSAGDYQLTVSYTGEANCNSSDQITVRLFDLPSAAFRVSDNVICAGSETLVSLDGPTIAGADYSWSFPGASPATATGALSNFPVSWAEDGPHNVQLVVTSNGCTDRMDLVVEVSAPANAGNAVGDDLQLCAGNSETINLNTLIAGQDPGGVWDFAPGGNPSNSGLNLSTGIFDAGSLPPGDYRFAYTIDGTTCPTVTTELGLLLLGAPVADAGPDQLITCTMGMVSLNGTNSDSGEGFTYRWTTDDPNITIMDPDQPMIDVGQPGVYQLEVTNAIGCSSTNDVIVTAETEAPVMEVELSQITCFQADDGAILVTNVNGGRAPYTFSLNGEERGQSTLFAGLEPAEYDLMITDANGCFSNILIDMTEPDELSIRLRFPGDSIEISYGEEIFITASVNGGNAIDTLLWQPDSIKTTEGGLSGIEFTATETQMISVTVVDELGCSATDREMLLVRKDRPIYFPTAFSPNGDNINDIYFIGGDLDEIDFIEDFFIYDRWGEAVYTGGQVGTADQIATPGDGSRFLPNDPDFGWDGMLNGRPMNPQVLVYTATVHFSDGEVIVYKGDFVLLR